MADANFNTQDDLEAILTSIIEQALGFAIEHPVIYQGLYEYKNIPDKPALSTLKYYIQNSHIITEDFIRGVVADQLSAVHTWTELEFDLHVAVNKSDAFAIRWQKYLDKLELILAEVDFRTKHNFELNLRMPPQRQLLELQQECLALTAEWYGSQNSNIACFYIYYIRMCEAAHITRYKYMELSKKVSTDYYISQVSIKERQAQTDIYAKNIYQPFILQGGQWTHGRCEIDATNIANVLYAKFAYQLLLLQAAKHAVVQILRKQRPELQITNYGQVLDSNKEQLWTLIQRHFPADELRDQKNIFYQFAKFINSNPGAYFTSVPEELLAGHKFTDKKLHTIVQVAGLVHGDLTLISRSITENWTPKRYLQLNWQRKYPLNDLRLAGIEEHMRIWPNEMAYCPDHGLSLCGDGLLEGLEHYNTLAYEWNIPIDSRADIENTARDIEKMFREMQLLCPNLRANSLLPGEKLLNVFQNTVAYSTQSTQHIHITSGSVEDYRLYELQTDPKYIQALQATLDLVQLGECEDAMFVKLRFACLDNEPILKFLIALNTYMLKFFGGIDYVDVMLVLLPTSSGEYVFIYEPHARLLQQADGNFLNPENLTLYQRKPQWVRPLGFDIGFFDSNEQLSGGFEFLKKFYADTCKQGVHACIKEFIAQWLPYPEGSDL